MNLIEALKECKEIPTDPGYFIHPTGRVYKVQEMTGTYDNGSGYSYIKLSGGASNHSIHRLVASSFCENPDGKKEVDHIDGNKSNNHYQNLQWLSKVENVGKHFRKEYVFEHSDGRKVEANNIRQFARDYNLDSSAVSKVVKGKLKSTGGWKITDVRDCC